jgi:hypothetical protein
LPSALPLGPLSTPVIITTVATQNEPESAFHFDDAIELFPDFVPDLLDRDDVSITSSVPSTDSIVDCCIDEQFHINALGFEPITPHYSDAIELDNASITPEEEFICHECHACSVHSSDRLPIDQFLFDAAWNAPILDSDCTLNELLTDHPVIAPHLHHDFDGPRAHFDDGAQVSTTHI